MKVGGKHSSPRIGPLGLGQEVSGSLPNAQTCFLGSLTSGKYKSCRAKVHANFSNSFLFFDLIKKKKADKDLVKDLVC